MNTTWSLDALYKSYEDETFIKDMENVKQYVKSINELPSKLSLDNAMDSLIQILKTQEEYSDILARLGSYISLRQAVDTTDAQSVAYMGQLEQIASEATKALSACDHFIASIDDLEQVIQQDPFLQEYAYLLMETKRDAQHRLADDVEEAIAKMNLSAGNAWSTMQEYLTSTLKVSYKDQSLTLSAIRNLAFSDDANVRKEAYDAEIKAYDTIKESVAFALNNIKSQVNTISDMRSFSSPLDMTLYHARMKKTTLDAMMETIKSYLPYFHSYLKQKANILGYTKGLPWWEMFAPLDTNSQRFEIADAKAYLVTHFKPFSEDMADMIETAFEKRWIDFYPRNGKVGGAFCANLPFLKESRILTNFDGTLSDVVTLAHELGHAYHGKMIETHRPLNTDYSMPVAETASTFNENIIMNAAIEETTDQAVKLSLIESQLQDLTQILCDIYSRFLFEQSVFEKRKTQFMFADELCDMMKDAQRIAYGDALDSDTLHPYMWINKSHYYSASLSFYNFPYAFGGLFARGLIATYEKEGSSFVPKYQALLHATTISSVEEVAHMVGVDIENTEFWKDSLETCKLRIEQFIDLSNSLLLRK